MMIDAGNETDVREEIACPLLCALGYRRGTPNDIIRENQLRIRYPHVSLGRKKPSKDPVLIGRPDYILDVIGSGRWVFEIKSPSVQINIDDVEQALTYARHPEINAQYVALCNGRTFEIYYGHSRSNDLPILRIDVDDINSLSSAVANVLGPEAIRRDCTPRPVDRGLSLGPGLRSSVKITGGSIKHESCQIFYPEWLPQQELMPLKEATNRITGLQISIKEGRITRQKDGRIVAEYEAQLLHEDMEIFAVSKSLNPIRLITKTNILSSDPESPSEFEFLHSIEFSQGEELFDVISWRRKMLEAGGDMLVHSNIFGHLSDLSFIGSHRTVQHARVGAELSLEIGFVITGTFRIVLQNEFC